MIFFVLGKGRCIGFEHLAMGVVLARARSLAIQTALSWCCCSMIQSLAGNIGVGDSSLGGWISSSHVFEDNK